MKKTKNHHTKIVAVVSIFLFLATLFALVFPVLPAQTSDNTIYIRADGTVDPPTAPIQRVVDVYTLTSSINESIIIERDNIVVDGAGYVLQSDGGVGLSLSHRTNVTVKNFRVIGFLIGIKLEYTNYANVSYNVATNNGYCAIWLQYSNSNVILGNTAANNDAYGIYLEDSHDNEVFWNTAANNTNNGIHLYNSTNNWIMENTAKNNYGGIRLIYSRNNTVFGNTVSNNNQYAGISLVDSPNSTVSDNTATNNNLYGIQLSGCGNSVVSGNVMSDNKYNFVVFFSLSPPGYGFDMTVDLTNVADGNPIYYMRNAANLVLDSSTNAATIYVIDSTNVTVKDLNLAKNGHGIYFFNTNNSRIQNVVTTDNLIGICLDGSHSNFLWGNTIANNGIPSLPYLPGLAWGGGIYIGRLRASSSNVLADNIIADNVNRGISIEGEGNIIFHNNIINNGVVDLGTTTWDNGAEGNYWYNYTGEDLDGNGIGDSPYLFDNYPLMEPWSEVRVFNITWLEETFKVITVSKSTIASLTFNQTGKQISFKTTGPTGTQGFCDVTIPKELLDAPLDQWTVTVEDETVTPKITKNATHTFFHFNFTHSTKTVKIVGTDPIDNTQPVANAGLDQVINENTNVTFDGSASIDNIGIISYIWTFIDQTPKTLTGVHPTYLFVNPGSYAITLNVTDVRGNWDTDTVTITVLDITAPVAHAGRDQTVEEDTLVTFDGSSSTDNVAPTGYVWTFMDVATQTLTEKSPTYTFQTPGIYTVTLNVTDAAGNWHTDTVTITVLDVTAPTADAGPDQKVNEDVPLSFNASLSSDNVEIVAYTWTFTDETLPVLDGPNPSYVFTTPGAYTVTLNVTDAAGNWDTDTVTIVVLDVTAPVAHAGNDQTVEEDVLVTFDGSKSTDNVAPAGYTWTFMDVTPKTLTGKNPTNVFQTPGNYTVLLNVTDAAGNWDTDTVTVKVIDVTAPIADAGLDQKVDENMLVGLDGSKSTDNVGTTSWTWTFIDMTPKTLAGENVTYTFAIPSVYTVTLNVTDAAGNWDTDTVTVKVIDVTAPIADAGLDQKVDEGGSVSFNASASSDNVNIASYTWTFDDKTPQVLYGPNPSYAFITPGTYNVTLNVTDAAGNWDTDTIIVTVRARVVPIWTQSWFWFAILSVPTIFSVSYLVFWYGKRGGIYEQLQKLVRQYVRNRITKDVFEKRLKDFEERVDVDTRARIREYLDVIMTYERAVAYIDIQKKEKK